MDHGRRYTLHLYGPAGLYRGEAPVRLGAKALFILYYLALEGPTRREVLAELLWGHPQALQNLRVELFRLKEALQAPLFSPRQDPLRLPSWIGLDEARRGEALEGLERAGGEEWVYEKRAELEKAPQAPPDLLEALEGVGPPFLLVLRGEPGSGRRSLAQALARRLNLPLREGLGREAGVRLLREPYPEEVDRILQDSRSVYVLLTDPGEDPACLLRLRSRYPPERVRSLLLPPLSFLQARATLLKGLPFLEAARWYLAAGGNPGHLRAGLDSGKEVPQTVRAQVLLLARRLSLPARRALERLSLQKGRIPEPLLEAFEGLPHLAELEEKEFLAYHEGYRFARDRVRRVLVGELPPGMRRHLHEQAVLTLAMSGHAREEAYHRLALGEAQARPPTPPWKEAGRGREVYFLELNRAGAWEQEGEGYVLAHLEPHEESLLRLELPPEARFLLLEGEAFREEDPYGLEISLQGAPPLALEGRFSLAFLASSRPILRFQGQGVAAFTLKAFTEGSRPLKVLTFGTGVEEG
jgi:hypothetical protein